MTTHLAPSPLPQTKLRYTWLPAFPLPEGEGRGEGEQPNPVPERPTSPPTNLA
jgi:hypothetical protein